MKENWLKSQCVRAILESILPWSGLGCYKALGHDPSRAFCFLGNSNPEVQALIVQVWSSKSRIVFYKGSHLRMLDPRPATNGFLDIPLKNLTHHSIEDIEIEMEEGGLYDLSHIAVGYAYAYMLQDCYRCSSRLQDYSWPCDQFRIRDQRRIERVGSNEASRPSQSQESSHSHERRKYWK